MKSHSVKVSESGRIGLPAEVRRALGIVGPGHLVLTMEDGEVRLSTVEQALTRVQVIR